MTTNDIRYRIKLLNATKEEIARLEGYFDAPDSSLIRGLVQEAERLSRAAFVQDGMTGPLVFHFDAVKGTASGSLPPRSVVAEFIHQLRPFVLHKEPCFFPKVLNVVARKLRDDRIHKRFDLWRDQFNGKASQSTFTFTVADQVVNSDETLRLWLNAFEYHRDDDKQQALAAVFGVVPEEACQVFFFDLLVSKSEAVLSLADLLNRIISSPANVNRSPT
jgi:hypothetical protein